MPRSVRAASGHAAFTALAILLASCASVTRLSKDEVPPEAVGLEARLAASGPEAWTVEQGSMPGAYGCAVA
jgi:hypothetical protein